MQPSCSRSLRTATCALVHFRTSAACKRFHGRSESTSKGLEKLVKALGKNGKSGGMQLQGGARVRMAYIKTKADEDKKARLRAETNIVRDLLGADVGADVQLGVLRRRGPQECDPQALHTQLWFDDAVELAVVQTSSQMKQVLEGAALGALCAHERAGQVHIQESDVRQTLDEYMGWLHARQSDEVYS